MRLCTYESKKSVIIVTFVVICIPAISHGNYTFNLITVQKSLGSTRYKHFATSLFLRRGIVSPRSNPPARGPTLVVCPRLLTQYIRSYPPYLEAVSSIHKLKTCHAVMTRVPLHQYLNLKNTNLNLGY
jgi:hypothetical protein